MQLGLALVGMIPRRAINNYFVPSLFGRNKGADNRVRMYVTSTEFVGSRCRSRKRSIIRMVQYVP